MDQYVRLYSRLHSLKANLPENKYISENYVQEYHIIIDDLSKAATIELSEFKIPPSEIKPSIIGNKANITGELSWVQESSYSETRYCERNIILSKMDALLMYFQISNSKEKESIGFKPPTP